MSRRKVEVKKALSSYAFIAIPLAIMIIFIFTPIIYSLVLTFFQRKTLSGEMTFIGLDNYTRLFSDPKFMIALKNTIGFAIVVVPIQTFLALLTAYVLSQKVKFKKGFRFIYFLPTLTSSTALTMIFMYLFSLNGPVTEFMFNVGLLDEKVNLLSNPNFAMKIIMAMNIWSTVPFFMTIYFARITNLSKEVYEAADIDGVNSIQRFFKITVPQLSEVTFFVVLTGVVGTLQMFDQAFIFSGGSGGPNNSTLTVTLYIYNMAFDPGLNGMGYASTMAIILGVVIFTITFVVRKVMGDEQYEY